VRAQSTDEIFIRAAPRTIIESLTRLNDEHAWWPGARTRGAYGWVEVSAPTGRIFSRVRFRASISPVREWEGFTWMLEQGELRGRAEWWIEAFKDGAMVHHYLDCERGDAGRWRRLPTILRRHRWAIRRGLNALKDRLESLPAGQQRR
jgi:hypothetical protein